MNWQQAPKLSFDNFPMNQEAKVAFFMEYINADTLNILLKSC